MNPELLAKMFEFNHYCLEKNTKGLTHEDSLVQPHPGGNCLNWVLGHIVATRNSILKLLRESPIWRDEEAALYIRGSKPIQNGDNAHSFEKILNDYNRSQESILNALKGMSKDAMETKIDEETLGEKLAGLHFHEAYHVGQIGVLRRIAGKEGAIQ